ncbi:MAG: hypothetical protein PHT40_01295 [Patescibacteria group bacterium]|nr:hypothetical protein [Patescibacteria group bacterium]
MQKYQKIFWAIIILIAVTAPIIVLALQPPGERVAGVTILPQAKHSFAYIFSTYKIHFFFLVILAILLITPLDFVKREKVIKIIFLSIFLILLVLTGKTLYTDMTMPTIIIYQ